MKNNTVIYISLLALILAACNSNSNKTEEQLPILRPSEMVTVGQDTTDVMDLVNQYMSMYKAGDLDGAASMLHIVRNDSCISYTQEQRNNYVKAISAFNVYDYKIVGLTFNSEKDNEVKVKIQIVPQGDLTSDKGVMSIVFNPVKLDNHWQLTLVNPNAE